MFVPELVFCLVTTCYLAASAPVDTEERCRERVELVMLPLVRQSAPGARIVAARCRPHVEPLDPAV